MLNLQLEFVYATVFSLRIYNKANYVVTHVSPFSEALLLFIILKYFKQCHWNYLSSLNSKLHQHQSKQTVKIFTYK